MLNLQVALQHTFADFEADVNASKPFEVAWGDSSDHKVPLDLLFVKEELGRILNHQLREFGDT